MIVCNFVAEYFGLKTGNSKKDPTKQWYALQFKVSELYKGVEISIEQLSDPNVTIFPPENANFSFLKKGQKYSLQCGVDTAKGSSYPQFTIHQVKSQDGKKIDLYSSSLVPPSIPANLPGGA